MKKYLIGAAVPLALVLGAAGYYTNNFPRVGVLNSSYTYLQDVGLVPVDTQLPGGAPPQTVAASVFEVGAVGYEATAHVVAAASGTVACTTTACVGTSPETTVSGANFTLTFTDSLIAVGSSPRIVFLDTGTAAGVQVQVLSETVTAGQVVVVFQNSGTVTMAGTYSVAMHI